MADLMTALRNADAAGDTEAATRIAAMIKSSQQAQQEQAPQQQEPPQQEKGFDFVGGGFGGPVRPTENIIPEVAPQDQINVSQNDVEPQEDSILGDAFNVLSELAAASNRSVAGFLDFLGPDTVNAVLRLSGVDYQVPTIEGALKDTGIHGGFMDEGTARDIVQGTGSLIPAAAGMKSVKGRDLAKTGEAFKELLGFGSATPAKQIASFAAAPITEPVTKAVSVVADQLPASKASKAATLPLLRKSGEVAAAGFKLDDAGRAVKDKTQQLALKAGVDEGAVAMIAASDKPTKTRMKSLMEALEKGKKSLEFRNFNPPQKVLGEALQDRLSVIQRTNAKAASQLDEVANSLKGQRVDVAPAMNNFIAKLEKQGIGFNPATGKLKFGDSSIDRLPKAQKIIKDVVDRLHQTKDPTNNAYRAHIAKKFIDEHVTYGKSQSGLSGTMVGIVKGLRHDIDAALDSTFPLYDKVNTNYSKTREVIDEVQRLAGARVDLTGPRADKSLGTMSRKVLSNYNTGAAMEDLFDSLDTIAKQYGDPLTDNISDDLRKLVSMEAEMRRMFPTATKPNTLQGNMGMEAARVAGDLAIGNKVGLAGKLMNKIGSAFSGDEEAKIKAIKALLAE